MMPFLPQPKPESRKKLKLARRAVYADHVAKSRAYVFGRERGVCRCCRSRTAESMHELRPRSIGGRVSRRNSVAVCGSGTTGCHGYLQSRAIAWCGSGLGADGPLTFVAMSMSAAAHMRVAQGHSIYSPLMQQTEIAE